MDYEYVQLKEEENLKDNFKRQLEIHNRKQLAAVGRKAFTNEEFEKILIYLEGGTRFEKAKKLRDLFPLDTNDGQRIWVEFLDRQSRERGFSSIEAGCDYKTVSVLLGHSNISTTLDLYVHPNMEQKKRCISKVFKSLYK